MELIFSGSDYYLDNKNAMELVWVITRNCNYDCHYCFDHNNKSDFLSFEKCKKIVDFIFEIDKDINLNLTGGECTSHPDFIRIIEYINYKQSQSSKTKMLTIFTNLSKDPDFYINFAKKNTNLNVIFRPSFHREYLSYEEFYNRYYKLKDADLQVIVPRLMIHSQECLDHFYEHNKLYPDNEYLLSAIFFKEFLLKKTKMENDMHAMFIYKDNDKYIMRYESQQHTDYRLYVCNAFKQMLYISEFGLVYSCVNFKNPRGNIFNDRVDLLEQIKRNQQTICLHKNCFCNRDIPRAKAHYKHLLDMNKTELHEFIKAKQLENE